MKTIYADFNAMTQTEQIRLTTRGSLEDIEAAQIQPGDWAWLSDGELVVGARVAIEPGEGLVGEPEWDTLVHLDADDARDFNRVWSELQPLMQKEAPRETTSVTDEARIFRLLTQIERVSPPEVMKDGGYVVAMRRASALRRLGQIGLALLEVQAARRARPDDPAAIFVYLDLLGIKDLGRAVSEAEAFARSRNTSAWVLSACINILATLAERAGDEEFGAIADRVLDWCDCFEHAPDRERVLAPMAALTLFNRGLILLRFGRVAEAQSDFRSAFQAYPLIPALEEARGLSVFDQRALNIAHVVRQIAGRVQPSPAAA